MMVPRPPPSRPSLSCGGALISRIRELVRSAPNVKHMYLSPDFDSKLGDIIR